MSASEPTASGPVWVVLPTYNEAGNIEAMVEALAPKLSAEDRILIVDDNSPDGTGPIADRIAAAEPRVEVLHRPGKEGLGPAYIAGFRRALPETAFYIEPDYSNQMCADLGTGALDFAVLYSPRALPDLHFTLVEGDARETVKTISKPADAWFLDGFSPAKNPELWNADLMQSVFDKTAIGGTFATYTAAGWVRRNLQTAGFQVERVKGHAGKRQMTIGRKLST